MSNTQQLKELRQRTGAGFMDCKKALKATNGDLDKSIDWLREKGIAKAAKKANRVASEGLVCSYIHGEGRIGVLVEVNCETDFVARNEDFKELVDDLAMHIAASAPDYLRREEVPADVVEHERSVQIARAVAEGKPQHIAEKMVAGRMGKYYEEICLLEQKFIKDDKKSIEQVLIEAIAKIGEKIEIRRFTRYVMGEGLEKKSDDFANEVASMTGSN